MSGSRMIATSVVSAIVVLTGCGTGNDLGPGTKVADKKQVNPQEEKAVSKEALDRKQRSVAILKQENVPLIDDLPVIETEAESKRRSTDEVATRAIALCIVAVKGEGLDQGTVDSLVKQFDIAKAFTPKEKAFIENPNPTQQDRVQFSWRYECYWVMLWALGYSETLDRPNKVCDVSRAVSLLRDNGREGFLKKATLRAQSEILDAADLIYRYHWAVVDARINGREAPAGLDGGVVQERHHALNWLIGYSDQEWDHITTDT